MGKKQQALISDAQHQTAECKNLVVQIAISYGGKDEITRSVRKIAEKLKLGKSARMILQKKR